MKFKSAYAQRQRKNKEELGRVYDRNFQIPGVFQGNFNLDKL